MSDLKTILPSFPSDADDLFESAPCGYLTMHLNGNIVRANAKLADWTGYTAEELSGKRLHDILTFGTRLLYETSFAPQLNLQGVCEEMSLDLKTATGNTIAVSGSGQMRKAENGHPALIYVTLFKAAERRRYERQLVEARAQIQEQAHTTQRLLEIERETSELREQFIAVLGHDMRNPVGAMSAGLTLLRRGSTPERRDKLFNMLEETVSRMVSLIDNVLDFARGRLGAGIPLELRPNVMLAPVLEQVVAELRLSAESRIIESDLSLPKPIKCDPSRLGQMVSNLLGNALTHGSPVEPVHVHADAEDGVLTIWVANGGDPISEAAIGRLFHPFFRGEETQSQQGLGLGLHIASEIAKAHGGTLDVASTAQETRFTFRMPVAPMLND